MPARQSQNQTIILNLLQEVKQEIDAQDLYLKLRSQGSNIGLATVYRALKTLHKQGLIQERPSTSINGKSLYSATSISGHQQHHLNCLNCKRSIVVESCPIDDHLDHLFPSQKFKVYYHTLEFFGLCHDCQDKETSLIK